MQTNRFRLLKSGLIIFSFTWLAAGAPVYADEASQTLQLPQDLAEKANQGVTPKYTVEERRIGDRLDQITVRREGGIDEIYENTEVDSLWGTEDKELGETQNMRRWTIGSW